MPEPRLVAHLLQLGATESQIAGLDDSDLIGLAGDLQLAAGLTKTGAELAVDAGCTLDEVRSVYQRLGLRVNDLYIVELLRSYSNQTDVLRSLTTLLALPQSSHREQPAPAPRQRHRRLRDAQQLKLVESYHAGYAVKDLAREFGISRQTIAAILARHGIEHRQQGLSADNIAEASRLYESGWSLGRVGNHLHVDASTVRNVLRRIGAEIRPVGTNQWR